MGAGIGDSDEVLPGPIHADRVGHPVVEELEEGEGLGRAARLGGDDEQGAGQIEPLRVGQHSARVGAVEHGQVQTPLLDAEGPAEDVGSQAGAAHPQQQRVGVAPGAHVVDQPLQAGDVLEHGLSDVQPAQPVGDLRGLRLPDGVVVGPDAGHHPVLPHFGQRSVDRGLVRPQAGRLVLPSGQQPVAFLGDGRHQRREGSAKLGHPILLQLLGDRVQVHAQIGQAGHVVAGLVQPGLQRGRDRAVVAEGIERGGGHGVDRVRPDQAVHVKGVRVQGVLGAGAGPQDPLDAGALRE